MKKFKKGDEVILSWIKGNGIEGIIYRNKNGLIVNNGKRKAVKNNHFWDSEFLSLKSALPALWKVALLTSNKIVLSVGIGSSNS